MSQKRLTDEPPKTNLIFMTTFLIQACLKIKINEYSTTYGPMICNSTMLDIEDIQQHGLKAMKARAKQLNRKILK